MCVCECTCSEYECLCVCITGTSVCVCPRMALYSHMSPAGGFSFSPRCCCAQLSLPGSPAWFPRIAGGELEQQRAPDQRSDTCALAPLLSASSHFHQLRGRGKNRTWNVAKTAACVSFAFFTAPRWNPGPQDAAFFFARSEALCKTCVSLHLFGRNYAPLQTIRAFVCCVLCRNADPSCDSAGGAHLCCGPVA